MDFFAQQDRARRKTKWMVFYFALSILGTVAGIYAAFALIFLRDEMLRKGTAGAWNTELFLGVTGGTLFVILLGSLYKTIALRQGGSAVAEMLGGRPLDPNTEDLDEQKLLHVVEEMALASGTPVPAIYILENESGINAFAAGHNPNDAAIGVTRGCMRILSRDQLQGVIAHEFSHLLNGDMRLNLRLIGILNGILCIAIIGRVLLRSAFYTRSAYRLGARSRGKGGNPLPFIGLALLVIGSIGIFFGRLIKSAVSRQREFLADASAVQFTRNPAGIEEALKKIGGLSAGSRLRTPQAEEASHMYFGNGLGASWFKLFSTHPPLVERIRAIDPAFDGVFPPVELPEPPPSATRQPPMMPPPAREVAPPRLQDLIGRTMVASGFSAKPMPSAAAVGLAGAPTAEHLDFAAAWRAQLPDDLRQAAHEPLDAMLMVYGLVLDPKPPVQIRQLEWLKTRLDPSLMVSLERRLPALQNVPRESRLPLVDLCLTALRRLSTEQYNRFKETLMALIQSDQKVSLFEYALLKIVTRHLAPHFEKMSRKIIQYYSLRPLLPDAALLLSALAYEGADQPEQQTAAFEIGMRQLQPSAGPFEIAASEAIGFAALDQSLTRLAQAAPQIKKQLLNACAFTVGADGTIRAEEAELLRAIADGLDCPLPPFVQRTPQEAPAR